MNFTPEILIQQNIRLLGLNPVALIVPITRYKTLASFCYWAICNIIFFLVRAAKVLATGTQLINKSVFCFVIFILLIVFKPAWPIL